MILFLKDWKKYPTAIIDYNTTNKSFLRYAGLLKAMGVKNHAFPLALINPNLVGVNPHDPTISLEEMTAVVAEAKQNPWYIFREIIKIPASSGTQPVPLEANRGNIAFYWCFFLPPTVALLRRPTIGCSSGCSPPDRQSALTVCATHAICW